VDTPEARHEGNVAMWASRDEAERSLSLLALGLAAAYFITLFLPWVTGSISGWSIRPGEEVGLLALAVVLAELLRLMGLWTTRGADLLGFCLTAAAGVMGVTAWAVLEWASGSIGINGFVYGFWVAFVVALLLVAVAALRLAVLRRSAP
jgi:hypothetical protein